MILPGNAVFLHDIFYVFIFAAQCFYSALEGSVLTKRYMQQQQVFNSVRTGVRSGQNGNNHDTALILAAFADVYIALPDDNPFGPF